MRITFLLLLIIFTAQVKAQNFLSPAYMGYQQRNSLIKDSGIQNKKWFVSKSIGISNSFGFYKGGNVSIMAIPVVLQLNRKLSNNWYAFANISATPAYVNFNHSFLTGSTNKLIQNNGNYGASQFNIYPTAALGLMYVNDEKTFSISGSISVERSNNNFSPAYQPGGFLKPVRKAGMQ